MHSFNKFIEYLFCDRFMLDTGEILVKKYWKLIRDCRTNNTNEYKIITDECY